MRVFIAIFLFIAISRAQTATPLTVLEDSLPTFDVGTGVHTVLHAKGGAPPYRWKLVSGDLPEGIQLTPDGFLSGRPVKAGISSITINVEDSNVPAHSINKELRVEVHAALILDWVRPPLVRGNRIDGVVQVSNGSRDDYDLTFIIVGVNDIGRATALGYQRVTLKAGTENLQIPFGETLPRGTYVVHADAVAEIAAKGMIVRRQLETPAPLPVTQGP